MCVVPWFLYCFESQLKSFLIFRFLINTNPYALEYDQFHETVGPMSLFSVLLATGYEESLSAKTSGL